MTYQVLARKWRPKNFRELIGQPHVSKALMHALKEQRLHHAYLFTGTRGIGKTTVARILAKSLNCEQGIVAEPCGSCSVCREIDEGRFQDLIEVDAASRTKVEDTRDLLENVIYAPTRGRFKIYLIDEVHMLSGHSFNALLKTLEEPPEHVKFLFATTDPERLPVTILSRCLHFNLRPISLVDLNQQLIHILEQENIVFDAEAVNLLAKAAKGSLRDSLSLLEQAIAMGEGKVDLQAVKDMLGLCHQELLLPLIKALCDKNPQQLFQITEKLAQSGADFINTLEAMLDCLQALSMMQMVPEAKEHISYLHSVDDALLDLHTQLTPEQTQLYYQIALTGKKDISLVGDLQRGFEMLLLRMLSFQPFELPVMPHEPQLSVKSSNIPLAAVEASPPTVKPIAKTIQKPAEKAAPPKSKQPVMASPISGDTLPKWAELCNQLPIVGLVKVLAQNCVVAKWALPEIELILEESQAACLNDDRRGKIEAAVSQHLGQKVRLAITAGDVKAKSPAAQKKEAEQSRHAKVMQELERDPLAQSLVDTFDAKLTDITMLDED